MAGSQLGWEPGWFGKPRRRPCIEPAVPRGLGVLRRDLLWKGGLSKALLAQALFLTLPAQERRQVCQHGLTRAPAAIKSRASPFPFVTLPFFPRLLPSSFLPTYQAFPRKL